MKATSKTFGPPDGNRIRIALASVALLLMALAVLNVVAFGSISQSLLAATLFGCGAILLATVARHTRELERIATTDALTLRPNRLAFIAALRNVRGEPSAIVLVDVTHFKTINNALGHEAADAVLLALCERIESAAPSARIMARVGGDEFALLHLGPQAEEQAWVAAQRVLSSLAEPLRLAGERLRVGVTIGLAAGVDTPEASLLKNADIALQAAKANGRGQIHAFHDAMRTTGRHRERLREDLRDAVERGELHLVFQPIVDLGDRRTRGFEALLRWTHPAFGSISPAEFVPLAEETGLIVPIGRWVVEQALRQARLWPDDIFVAVNMSARQLGDVTLPDVVGESLLRHGIRPSRLEFEITEGVLIENDAEALTLLHRLRDLGCRFSLDDFGTGYASLSYLRRFPFSKLKIDQFFLRGGSDEDVAIIRTVCELADRLALEIVAEGVETEENRKVVLMAGGRLGQGYLFDRPLSADASLERLARERQQTARAASRTPEPPPVARGS